MPIYSEAIVKAIEAAIVVCPACQAAPRFACILGDDALDRQGIIQPLSEYHSALARSLANGAGLC